MTGDVFERELCELVERLSGTGIRLIVGGGYGLVLRQRLLREQGVRTLRWYPPARSTQDIDLFFAAELMIDAENLRRFRQALEALGYVPVESAKHYQFVRQVSYAGSTRSLKIDLLAALPKLPPEKAGLIRADSRRLRNRAVKLLHAHVTPEALTVEEHLLPVEVAWQEQLATVYVPHPFSYLLLKLFALRDQLDSQTKRFGRYHAFDLYAIVAMMTEVEWDQAVDLGRRYAAEPQVREATAIVRHLFSEPDSTGMIRIREHLIDSGEQIAEADLRRFAADLLDLFPV